MIDKRKALSFSTLVIPWLTAPLIGKNSFVRFLPVATFIGYIFSLLGEIADRRKWWKSKKCFISKLSFRFLLPFRLIFHNNYLGV